MSVRLAAALRKLNDAIDDVRNEIAAPPWQGRLPPDWTAIAKPVGLLPPVAVSNDTTMALCAGENTLTEPDARHLRLAPVVPPDSDYYHFNPELLKTIINKQFLKPSVGGV